MSKKEILSRFNLKDYNKELEIILEEKDFSSQVKNLLLSMFYKLEIGYRDYIVVKQDSPTKESFMESLLYLIKEKCEKIELIKPNIEKQDEKKFIANAEEKSISCYQNEAVLFHSLLELSDKNFNITDEEDIIKIPFQSMLKKGYEIDVKEVITNFDGWSWNNNLDKTDDLDLYILYELLRIIMGNNFMYEWKRDRRKNTNYINDLKKKANELYKSICLYCIAKYAVSNEGKGFINESLKVLKDRLRKMEEKDEFLKEMYLQKKSFTEEVKVIDKILSDKALLKKEFLSRNNSLSEDNKIFSVSDLTEIMQEERNKAIQKLDETNKILEPKNYLKKIQKLQEDIELVESSGYKKVTDDELQQKLINVQICFIETLKKIVTNINSKKEIIELIYKFRYYMFLPIVQNSDVIEIRQVGDLAELISKLENKIITKACKLKALIIVNRDINYNSKILQKIINTRTIDLSCIHVIFTKQNEDINIEIFENEVMDRNEKIKMEKEKDFNIKFEKKVKLFTLK